MTEPYWIDSEDWHTAGEPFRIVPRSPSSCQPEGSTIAERWQSVVNTKDHPLDTLRRSLCHEPRGHADMYGGFLFPGDDPAAHLGVLFFHKDGFSTACGHGTIALGMYAVTYGLVQAPMDGTVDVIIDVPSGRVTARVYCKESKATGVDFINVASYPLSFGQSLDLPSFHQPITLDIAWGGAVYAYVDSTQLKLGILPENHLEFIRLGRMIKKALGEKGSHKGHGLYGVCFYEEEGTVEDALRIKNVVVFADGQIDRSPCGSGTAAKVAILNAQGRMKGKRLVHRSIVNSEFVARIDEIHQSQAVTEGSCIPTIHGTAHLTGRHQFYIDPADSLYPGFVFR